MHLEQDKHIGCHVHNFNSTLWNIYFKDIAVRGNYAKFSETCNQDGRCLATGDRLLAEASPFDTLWGIGILACDPDALYQPSWPGRNLLGNVLHVVRCLILANAHPFGPLPCACSAACVDPSANEIHEIGALVGVLPRVDQHPSAPYLVESNWPGAPTNHSSDVVHVSATAYVPPT